MQKKMTSIKSRVLRGMIIAVSAATVILTVICTLVLFLTITNNSEEDSLYTLSVYSDYISGTLQNVKSDKADAEMKKIVSGIQLGADGYGYIINKDGDIIYHPDEKQVSNRVNYVNLAQSDKAYKDYAEFTKTIISGKAKSDVVRIDGVRCYLTGRRIENSDGWYLISVQPYQNIIKDYYLLLFICIGTTAVLIFLATVIAFYVANRISRSLEAVTDRLNKLSQGDLDSAVPVINSNDETEILANSLNVTIYNLNSYVADIDRVLGAVSNGDLTTVSTTEYSGSFMSIKQALNDILVSLNTIFKDVVTSTETIKSTATQVASGAGLLSDNAANEAATLQELSSTVSTVSEMVTSNASSAAQASKLAATSNIRMSDGAKKMAELTEAMHDIEASADEISKINKVIEDIAFQTNILALNASVEAARAGEAGKGFAVVADEVRNLASKSSQASQNTSVLIENAICGIRTGAALADETTESLNGIADMVNNVNEIMGEIARASNEQATAIYQISQGMENITNSVQTTSATAEESAAASQELSTRSSQTMNLVGKYRTK